MYDSLGSHFFRTTNGIQPGPDAFDESRLVMTFVTNLGVTNILCSFRLVLKGKASKEKTALSRFEFLEKFSSNSFRCRRQHVRAVKQRRYSRFNFVRNTISNSSKLASAKSLGSNRVCCFIFIRKFDSFKNHFAMTITL